MIDSWRDGEILYFTAPLEWDGLTVEELVRDIWQLPRKIVHQFRMNKTIELNGESVHFHKKIHAFDTLSIKIFHEVEEIEPYELDIDVLYEDEHLIVVNKPANLSTHPNELGDKQTLLNAVAYYLLNKNETCQLQHIHRLDKDTTGAILFSKHPIAGVMMDRMLTERKIRRTYTALVHGKLQHKQGTIHAKIGRDRHHPTRRRVSNTGQDAITHYEVIHYDSKRNLTQIYCKLDTGRTHQIRVHLSHIGHPLAGDVLYGGKPLFPRQALHAKFLSFIHPLTLEKIEVVAPYLDKPAIFLDA